MNIFKKKIWIRGAGDLATGIALRLYRCGFIPVLSDIKVPTTVRRTVAFSRAIYEDEAIVEGICAVKCENEDEIAVAFSKKLIPVMEDENGMHMRSFHPDIVIDAIIAKKNLGTRMDDGDLVIGIGPGFYAGVDCHAVIETNRGHNLGRVFYEGSAEPNTGIPGNIAGFGRERIIRAVSEGYFKGTVNIGDYVKKGDIVGYSGDHAVFAELDGVVRGLLQDGVYVRAGMKSGDIDPRAEKWHCYTVSDKASAIGGGVLEAILSHVSKFGGY